MQIISVDVSSDFIYGLIHGKSGNTAHGKGRGKFGCNWKHRYYLQTIEAFVKSEAPVMLVLLDDEDNAYRISSGFMECIRRHEIEGVKSRVRQGLVYLVRTDREEVDNA